MLTVSPPGLTCPPLGNLNKAMVASSFECSKDYQDQSVYGVESTFELLFHEFKQHTPESEQRCRSVATRLASEVDRICAESSRIQSSGEVGNWSVTLARHRLKQCLKYYRLGSRQGRVELHSTLSAVVYRYVTIPKTQASYQARLTLIEDFLQGFYIEALNAFRRENALPTDYCPRSLLELAEYMAFTERYGKRRIPLPGRRSQQLIILRAQTFSHQQPPEAMVDMEQAAEGGGNDSDYGWNTPSVQQVREQMVSLEPEPSESDLRSSIIRELIAYLEERQQDDCIDYFTLRLQDLPTHEIEELLHLSPRQRDYLQQRFKYHLIRFALTHHWELVHLWLEADLEQNFGLPPQKWQIFTEKLPQQQQEILHLRRQGLADSAIAQQVGMTPTQLQKQWTKILELAWEIRNSD